MSALRRSSSAVIRSPDRDPDARRHGHAGPLPASNLERLVERVEQALGDELGPCRQRHPLGDHHELVPAEAAQRVGVAYCAAESGGDPPQKLVADAVAERVVDVLEVVEVDEQHRRRGLVALRARERLFGAIQDQGAVRKTGQRIVGCEEGKLLLAPRQVLIGSPALALKALAHPQQAELEAQLQLVHCPGERVGGDVQLCRAVAHHLGHRIAPLEATPGDLVQRHRTAHGEVAKDLPGLPTGIDCHLHGLTCDPPGDSHRGAPADSFEAVLHHGVDVVIVPGCSADRQREHVLDTPLQCLAQTMEVLRGLIQGRRWRQRRRRLPGRQRRRRLP